nr:MAG TPA: hypothetical protein [Microviridae sp.]
MVLPLCLIAFSISYQAVFVQYYRFYGLLQASLAIPRRFAIYNRI